MPWCQPWCRYTGRGSRSCSGSAVHAVSDIGCECCKPDSKFKLIPAEQIIFAPVTDDTTFSLKVCVEAYLFAMQEITGGVDSEFSIRVLNECRLDISKGRWMEVFRLNRMMIPVQIDRGDYDLSCDGHKSYTFTLWTSHPKGFHLSLKR